MSILYYGDNLQVIRKHLAPESVDMILEIQWEPARIVTNRLAS